MNKSILVVDDEPNVRLSYRMALETEGYSITEADRGSKALEYLAASTFDLAILDVRMPEMDGLELLAKMRERGYATPSVIITAHGDVPHAVLAMKLGAIDFLQKPLTPIELRTIVSEVIERHEKPEGADTESDSDSNLSAEDLYDRYLKRAKRLLNLQDFGPARNILAKAMALDPLSVEAFNLAGVLFEMLENYDKARKYYGQAVKLDKDYEPAQQNLRRIHDLSKFGSSLEALALGDDR